MFKYFKMKKAEWKIKGMFYGTIVSLIEDKEVKETIDTLKKVLYELKDVPPDEIRQEVVTKIAEFAHEQAVKERELEAEKSN